MAVQEEQRTLAVVILGSFNPAIFQPAWFAAEELLPLGEAENAVVEVVHPEVSIFEADWLRLEVTRERLAFVTPRESHFEALRDLAIGTLTLLRHTPTRVCGVNHSSVLQYPDRKSFDGFGWRLSPRDLWEPVLTRPGVVLLDEQGVRPDERDGYIRVRLQTFLDGTYRVRLEVNDHFDFSSAGNSPTSTEALTTVISEEWTAIDERAKAIVKHLRGLST